MGRSPTGRTDHVKEDRMRTADQRPPRGRTSNPRNTGSTGYLPVSGRPSAAGQFVPGPR